MITLRSLTLKYAAVFWAVALVTFILINVATPTKVRAQPQWNDIQWKLGRELEKELELAVSAELNGSEIRDALYQFGLRKSIGVFVDRRVDPNLNLHLSLVDVTVEQLLLQVAESHDYGMCRLGDIFYVGPKSRANELDILLEQRKQDYVDDKTANDVVDWRKKERLGWEELTKPRDILLKLAVENNFKIVNPELIPHDLWPEVHLPGSTLETRVALLLSGFDLWFKSSGKGHVKIVRWPKVETGTRVIRNVLDTKNVARRLRAAYSDCKFVAKGRSLKIVGPTETVGLAVREVMDLRQPNLGDPALQRFTLDTTAKRSSILKTLARQMGLKLEFSKVLDKAMAERVTVKQSHQPAVVIIKAILKGTGARHRIIGERLIITK